MADDVISFEDAQKEATPDKISFEDATKQAPSALHELIPGFERGVNDFAANALKVGASIAQAGEGFDPEGSMFNPEANPPRSTADFIQRTRGNPLYKLGNFVKGTAEGIPAPQTIPGKAAEMAGGTLPLMATGPVAPAVMGLSAAQDTIDSQYDQNRKAGMSDKDAADKALDTAAKVGLSEGAIWGILPKPIKALLKGVTGKIGGGAVKEFLVRRVAGAVEGGALGASSQTAKNLLTGRPAGENVGTAALGTAAGGAVLPQGDINIDRTDVKPPPGAPPLQLKAPPPQTRYAGGPEGPLADVSQMSEFEKAELQREAEARSRQTESGQARPINTVDAGLRTGDEPVKDTVNFQNRDWYKRGDYWIKEPTAEERKTGEPTGAVQVQAFKKGQSTVGDAIIRELEARDAEKKRATTKSATQSKLEDIFGVNRPAATVGATAPDLVMREAFEKKLNQRWASPQSEYGPKGALTPAQETRLGQFSKYLDKEDVNSLDRMYHSLAKVKPVFPYDIKMMDMLAERLGYEPPERGPNPYADKLPPPGEPPKPPPQQIGGPNAPKEITFPGSVPSERSGNGPGGPPAETSAGGGVPPAAGSQGPEAKTIAAMPMDKFQSEMKTRPGGLTGDAWRLGQSAKTPEDLKAIQDARVEIKARVDEFRKKGDLNSAMAEANRGQYFREAEEAATGTGSAGKALSEKDPNYKPPFPAGKPTPEVTDVQPAAKNAKELVEQLRQAREAGGRDVGFKPAIKRGNGEIVEGLPNETHPEIRDRAGITEPHQRGYTKGGKFYNSLTDIARESMAKPAEPAPEPAKPAEAEYPKELTDLWGDKNPPPKGVGSMFTPERLAKDKITREEVITELNRLKKGREWDDMLEAMEKSRTPRGALRSIMLNAPRRLEISGETPRERTEEEKDLERWQVEQQNFRRPYASPDEKSKAKEFIDSMQRKYGVREWNKSRLNPTRGPTLKELEANRPQERETVPLRVGDTVSREADGKTEVGKIVQNGSTLYVQTGEGDNVKVTPFIRTEWKLNANVDHPKVSVPEYTDERLRQHLIEGANLKQKKNQQELPTALDQVAPGLMQKVKTLISDLRNKLAQQGEDPERPEYGPNRQGDVSQLGFKLRGLISAAAAAAKKQLFVDRGYQSYSQSDANTARDHLNAIIQSAEAEVKSTAQERERTQRIARLIESRKPIKYFDASDEPEIAKMLKDAGYGQVGKQWVPGKIESDDLPGPGEHKLEVKIPEFAPPPKFVSDFIDDYAKPFLKRGVDVARATKELIVNGLSPTSKARPDIVDTMFKSKGYKELFMTRAAGALEGSRNAVDDLPQEEQIKFVDRIRRGQAQPTKELRDLADLLRKWDNHLYNEAQQFKPDLEYLDNHYRTLWKVIPGTEGKTGAALEQIMSKRPWRGSRGFTLRHTLDDMSEGIARGGVPVSYNPVENFLLHAQDVMKFVAANRAWEDLKKSGDAVFVKNGEAIPEGFTRIQDSIAKPMFRRAGVVGKNGEWWVEQGAARLVNNFLSQDFIRTGKLSPIGKSLLDLKNATTAIELGFSPFHAVFVTNESLASSLALAFAKVSEGKYAEAGRTLLESSPSHIRSEGRAVERFAKNPEQFKEQYPETYAEMKKRYPDFEGMVGSLFDGGGQIHMNDDYRVQGIKGLKEAIKNDKYVGAVFRALPALNEKVLAPIFKDYIPRLKIGTFMREFAFEKNRRADDLQSGAVTEAELARQSWAFVEDRFGELNWDNLYWNRTFKSAMQLMFRSATWKLGTGRGYSKAFLDSYRELGKNWWKEGRAPRMTMPMMWLAGSTLVTAIQSSIISKVFTGQYPWELAKSAGEFTRNLLFPRIDKDDDTQRVSVPGYWKDLVHSTKHPLDYVHASMTGEIGRLWDVWNNKDFYGDKVYNEDDPTYLKAKDTIQHLFPVPFNISSFQAARQSGETPGRSMAGFLGFTKAPYYISHSQAELKAAQILRDQLPQGGLTKEEADKSMRARKALLAIKRGTETLSQAFEKGDLDEHRWREYNRITQESHLEEQMRHLKPEDAVRVYKVASPAERASIRDNIDMKIFHSKSLSFDEKNQMRAELSKIDQDSK